jgi:ubiquinone/menaquinone biosynthesis C-methylase UbiE
VNGRESAQYIIDSLKRHTSLENARLCEWGCGPARLIRHFPELLKGCNTELHGSDYNTRTIDWCRKNLPMITFSTNGLNPPLPYADGYFDVLYCVSVFTHLSPDNQERWLRECLRVLKSGGIFFLTVHGDTCTAGLSDSERKGYSIEGCVVRDGVTEGQRTYTSYNRPSFMRNVLLKDLEIAEYIAGTDGAQDIWIVRK